MTCTKLIILQTSTVKGYGAFKARGFKSYSVTWSKLHVVKKKKVTMGTKLKSLMEIDEENTDLARSDLRRMICSY